MKNTFKMLLSLMLSAILIIVVSAPVFAEEIEPRYVTPATVSFTQFTISNNVANCKAAINAPGATAIVNGTATLKDSSGNTIASWTNLYANGSVLNFNGGSVSVSSGTYTLYIDATVVYSNATSSVSKSATRSC